MYEVRLKGRIYILIVPRKRSNRTSKTSTQHYNLLINNNKRHKLKACSVFTNRKIVFISLYPIVRIPFAK
jgi:hypothetical protein